MNTLYSRYWSELHTQVKFIGIVIVGFLFIIYCRMNVTSSSVHVSGYTRSNGTKVSSYSRRPPGSVSHDSPYEIVGTIGILLFIGGSIGVAISFYRYKTENDFSLLPSICYNFNFPEKPYKNIIVPNKQVTAREQWKCYRCDKIIVKGVSYWLKDIKYTGRIRFCQECKVRCENDYLEYKQKKELFQNALIEFQDKAMKIDYKQYYKIYKVNPNDFMDNDPRHIYCKKEYPELKT